MLRRESHRGFTQDTVASVKERMIMHKHILRGAAFPLPEGTALRAVNL